jgi:hypothetical protein
LRERAQCAAQITGGGKLTNIEFPLDTLTGPVYTYPASFQLEFLTCVWSWLIASINREAWLSVNGPHLRA